MVHEGAESQYQLGLYYFLAGQEKVAERWIRYAARDGYQEAISLFELGAKMGLFSYDAFYIHNFAYDILATLITPEPQEEMVKKLEGLITQFVGEVYEIKTQK